MVVYDIIQMYVYLYAFVAPISHKDGGHLLLFFE